MKKFLAWLLLAAMMLSLAACSNTPADDDDANDTTPSQIEEESTEPVETEPEVTPPSFPDTNMEGKTFNVFTPSWYGYTPLDIVDIQIEESTGESLNDAAYERNLYMEEKYNCKVAAMVQDQGQTAAIIMRANRSGDGSLDWVLAHGCNFATLVTMGTLIELDDVPNVDYTNPWWNQESYESLSILNKHFGVASDLTTHDELGTWVVYFNKNIRDEYQLENPYEMVNNGTWTYDNVFTMASKVYDDLNGNGLIDYEDQFGISHSNDTTMGMYNSSGVIFAKNNAEGIPEFTYRDEQSVTKIMSILERLFDQQTCFNIHDGKRMLAGASESQLFLEGRILFLFAGVHNASVLRDMNDEFGILPYPKYDENQAEYLPSTSGLFLTLLVVPKCSPDLANLGIFLEEYAYYGHQYIRPVFYETLLQRKIARDEESLDMLELVFNNLIYDTGNIGNYGNTSYDIVVNLPSNYNSDVASFIERRREVEETSIAKIVNALREE